MLNLILLSSFEKDLKRYRKKHWSTYRLEKITAELLPGGPLNGRYGDHVLSGDMAGLRELHIEPNVLLLYKVTEDNIIFIRLGSHDDLFK